MTQAILPVLSLNNTSFLPNRLRPVSLPFFTYADEVIAYQTVNVSPRKPKKIVYDENSVYKDLKEDHGAWKIAGPYFEKYINGALKAQNADEAAKDAFKADLDVFLNDMTLRNVLNMSNGAFTYKEMRDVIDKLNS